MLYVGFFYLHICWTLRKKNWWMGKGGGMDLDLGELLSVFWHICPSSVPAAVTQSQGHTNTHWLKSTLSWLWLAVLPACGLLDLPLCCHHLIAALVQHGGMFMWPSYRRPNVPITAVNEIMLWKKKVCRTKASEQFIHNHFIKYKTTVKHKLYCSYIKSNDAHCLRFWLCDDG